MSWICVEGWICVLVPSGRMEERVLYEWVDGLDGDKGSEHLDAFLFLHLFYLFFFKNILQSL